MNTMHNPPHPGEVLREWLSDITVTDATARLGVTRVALSRVLNGAAGISAEWISAYQKHSAQHRALGTPCKPVLIYGKHKKPFAEKYGQ